MLPDIIPLTIMTICFCMLSVTAVRGLRLHTRTRLLALWDELTRWYLRLKAKNEIPKELEICFDTIIDDSIEPELLINVYYNHTPVFQLHKKINTLITGKYTLKKLKNLDFKKLTIKAYNTYMEDIIDGLDGIRPN